MDHRADIYALGVILFEMLTGCVPFGGEGYGEVLIKHVTVRPPAARSLVPELSPALDAILSRALAKDPELRFQSMAELREALLRPASYATAVPVPITDDDLSGRFRAAQPAARSEMRARPISAVETKRLTPTEPPAPPPTPASALDDDDDDELEPKRDRGGVFVLGLVGLAALAGVAVRDVTVRQEAAQLLGAVTRADVRQKSDLAYVDAAVAVTSRPAIARASNSLAPEADAPAVIVAPPAVEPPAVAAPAAAAPAEDPPLTDAPPMASMTMSVREHRPRHRARPDDLDADGAPGDDADDTLPPSAQ